MKYNISEGALWREYAKFDPNSPVRFGKFIADRYLETGQTDLTVEREPSDGVAYTMILRQLRKNSS